VGESVTAVRGQLGLDIFALGADGRVQRINDLESAGRVPHLLSQAFALSLVDGGKVPTEIQLGYAAAFQGHPRPFALTQKTFDGFIANHKAAGVDPPLDREHESIVNGLDVSPAQGWIKSLAYRDVAAGATKAEPVLGLFGAVDWTDLGEENVAKKHFRYTSMGFSLKAKDPKSNDSIGPFLDHVALVKKPFIQGMQALSLSAVNFPGRGRADGGTHMDQVKQYLCGLLGLKADATDEEVLAALRAHEQPVKLSLSAKGRHIVALSSEAIAALGLKTDATGGFSEMIVELAAKSKAPATELAKLEGEIKTLKAEKIGRDVEALIAAKKATPAEREELVELATSNPALFTRMAAKREPIATLSVTVKTPTSPSGQSQRDKQTKAIEEYQAKHPGTGYGDALRACAKTQPDLFKEEV
jgi:phage I-like protein